MPMTDDSAAPSIFRLMGEGLVVGEWWQGRAQGAAIARRHADGGGRPVLVIPGFLADDHLTAPLRRTLRAAGYRSHGWRLGQNRGVAPDLLDRLAARLEAVAGDGRAALVGWSLGGLYARALAHRLPARVERVVTLGSPFSGDLRANNAWRLYERVNDHPVDAPPIDHDLAVKPPVPTYALWSRRDGIVAPAGARGVAGEADRAIEVDCTHMGFVCAPAALDAILTALEA